MLLILLINLLVYNKYSYVYLKYILQVLIDGISWTHLTTIHNINTDVFRKKYNKWVNLNVFTNAYNIILKQYKNKQIKKKRLSNNLFIDSTNIANFSGKLDFGYNIKIKNKKSIKITVLVDENKIPYYLDVSKGSIHDAKITEKIVDTYFKNNKKQVNIIGDKGYIKNQSYCEFINKNYNINLITPQRKNTTNNKIDSNNSKLLKIRYVVEHFFSLLKRGYKRISIINDKTLNSYLNFLKIASSLIILNQTSKMIK